MRLIHFSACFLVAWSCAACAMRVEAVSPLSEGTIWLWWLATGLWWLAAAVYAAGAWAAYTRSDDR